MTGPFHFELVAKDGEFTVYVTDHAGNSIGVDGGLAKTTIETGSTIEGGPSRIQVELEPSGDNMLKETGTFTINQDTGIMVFLNCRNRRPTPPALLRSARKNQQTRRGRRHCLRLDFITIRTTLRDIARLVLVQPNYFHSAKTRWAW